MATRLEKVSFHSNPKEKGNAKECSNYSTVVLTLHVSTVMLKILQARLQYMNQELPDVQAVLKKGRETRDQLPTFVGLWRKQGSSRKTSTSLTILRPLTMWITTNWKILKRNGSTRPPYLSPKKHMQVKKQQLELDMDNELVPNWERSMSRLYIVTLFI